jgi:hypothetical protein
VPFAFGFDCNQVDSSVGFEHDYFYRSRYSGIAMLPPRQIPYRVLKVRRCPFAVGIWYTKDELFSTDTLLTKLMMCIIHAGCLTRYFCFEMTPYLDSYFVQYMLTGSPDCGEVPIFVLYSLSLMSATECPDAGQLDLRGY